MTHNGTGTLAIVFDIDGALLTTGAVAWGRAFEEQFGVPANINDRTEAGMPTRRWLGDLSPRRRRTSNSRAANLTQSFCFGGYGYNSPHRGELTRTAIERGGAPATSSIPKARSWSATRRTTSRPRASMATRTSALLKFLMGSAV